ncbi:hypothetical protein [Bdellovibrio sp. HCB-162]|uniref:hypothetical protein n=1 Tax=Bdellovibrio sp. HCB-162 TaxID=3394234 RepID=UPI0039BCF7C5
MKNAILFIAAMMLIACAKEDDSSGGLEGSWQTACTNGTSTSTMISMSFNGGTYTGTARAYDGLGCSTPKIEVNIGGTYIVGSVVKDDPKAYALDLTYGPTLIKPLLQSQVDDFNSRSYCGFNDWVLNVSKDISGITCDASQVHPVGFKYYDIFAIYNYSMTIDGTKIHDIGDLNFGYQDATYDGSTPEKRPIHLSTPAYRRK